MRGGRQRARHTSAGRTAARAVAVLAALAAAAAVLLSFGPAQAAAKHDNAQLSLSGLADKNNPTGGSRIGVHPGDTVSFTAAGVPTAGLAKLGLGDLVNQVNNLLGGATRFQVKADFAKLPGGHAGTILHGKKAARFTFRHVGTYSFTWVVQKVTVASGLLGTTTKVNTINLNGNELRQAGIKLNAKNQYVGSVVVSKHPPAGGISGQLPSIHLHPSAPGVGQLPTVGVPGAHLPTAHVTVPKLSKPKLPGVGGLGGSNGPGGGSGGSGPASGGSGTSFAPPAVLVPEEVVPHGDNAIVIPGRDNAGVLPAYHGGSGVRPGTTQGSNGSTPGVKPQPNAADTARQRTIEPRAAAEASPSGQLPVLLAIVAIITLALVAGTYARLFLVRRNL